MENGNTDYKGVLKEEPSWFQKILDWWNDLRVKPYVQVKDLNEGEGRKCNAVVAGIKISF